MFVIALLLLLPLVFRFGFTHTHIADEAVSFDATAIGDVVGVGVVVFAFIWFCCLRLFSFRSWSLIWLFCRMRCEKYGEK